MAIQRQSNLSFECRRWPYLLAIPGMWLLIIWVAAKKRILGLIGRKPKTNTLWFDGKSPILRQIKEDATSWRALEIVYNHQFGCNGRLSDFWVGMMNAQAVRNRLNLVKRIIGDNLPPAGQEFRILSVASGSAQGIIESLAELKKRGRLAEALLVDIDNEALEHSLKLAQDSGVADQIACLQKNVFGFLRLEKTLKDCQGFHLIEIVGFLEYVSDKMAVALIGSLRSLLLPGGVLVASSVSNNPERWFLHWVIDWRMNYRAPKRLLQLAIDGGFPREAVKIIPEPQSIFHLAVCKKL